MLRELAEWRRGRRGGRAARPGDLVLVDGSLHPGVPRPAGDEPVHELAREREVDLVGVTMSKLRWGRHAPLVLRARRAEDEARPRYPLVPAGHRPEEPSEVYVARLARAGAYAFRVDAVRGPATPSSCSRSWPAMDDPAFLGYLYPLAAVHRVVSLPGRSWPTCAATCARRSCARGCPRTTSTW